MLRFLARRMGSQWPLLVAVVAVVTLGATMLGLSALLIGASQQRGFDVATGRAPAADVDAVAYVVGVPGSRAVAVSHDTTEVIDHALAAVAHTTTTWASAGVRDGVTAHGKVLAGSVGYLAGLDGLTERARLTSGRWPDPAASALETVVPDAVAGPFGITPGDSITLGVEVRSRLDATPGAVSPAADRPVTVVVVGTYHPLPNAGWDRDPLGGQGVQGRYFASQRLLSVTAYGPFIVDAGRLLSSGSTMDRLGVTGHPLLPATPHGLAQLEDGVAAAAPQLTAAVGPRVQLERFGSSLSHTLAVERGERAATDATVLVVLLLGIALTTAALALTTRLVSALRADELALLTALGASRRQLVATAAAEAAALAALAGLLAVPLTAVAYLSLQGTRALTAAGLRTGTWATTASVAAIAAGAVVLATLLVAPSLQRDQAAQAAATRGRVEIAARSGVDVLLVALAAGGWWQLRAGFTAARPGSDVIRTLAPVLCLAAGAVLVLRLFRPLLQLGERLVAGARGLVLPLAMLQASRRRQATAAALLIVLGAAASTFGLGFRATWLASQRDQADLRVGTDLAVTLAVPPSPGDGAVIAAAAGAPATPVVRQSVVVGRWTGSGDESPVIVAVDTAHAGSLLRGRLPAGQSWPAAVSALIPAGPVSTLAVPDGATLTVTGSATHGAALQAAPQVVLVDAAGLRTRRIADPVRLDGKPHPLVFGAPLAPGERLVAVDAEIMIDATATTPADAGNDSDITLAFTVPGVADPAGATRWSVLPVGEASAALTPTLRVLPTAGGTTLVTGGLVNTATLTDQPVELVAVGFAPLDEIPVVVSQRLLAEVQEHVGDKLSLSIHSSTVQATIVGVVADIPSAPGSAAVLADAETLSRALIESGSLEPVTNAWWVGAPAPDAAARVSALGMGDVTTRTGTHAELVGGPLRVVLPGSLLALLPAAILLVLGGTALNVATDVRMRAVELARLRAIGVTRRELLRGLVTQHATALTVLVVAGALVGAGGSWLLAPLIIRSDRGGLPVPAVAASPGWGGALAVVALLVACCAATVTVVTAWQVRRSDSAHLRLGAA